MQISDSELNEQFDKLYREHHGWLTGWIKSRLGCAQLANDFAQDAFVKVLVKRSASQLQKPRAYLSCVARSLMIDLFRRRSLEQAYNDALALQPEFVEISPETRQCIIETLLEIDRLLDNLGERGREIFLMAQIDGLTYVEISRRLGVSVNTVRKHFIRAMTQCLLLIDD